MVQFLASCGVHAYSIYTCIGRIKEKNKSLTWMKKVQQRGKQLCKTYQVTFFLQKLCLLWKLLPFWLIFGKQVRAYLHGQKVLHYQLWWHTIPAKQSDDDDHLFFLVLLPPSKNLYACLCYCQIQCKCKTKIQGFNNKKNCFLFCLINVMCHSAPQHFLYCWLNY